MIISRKLIIALFAITLVSTVYAAVTLTSNSAVTVKEPLVITPPAYNISIYPGQSAILNFTVLDLSIARISTSVSAQVSPINSDITLTVLGGVSQTMIPGNNVVSVQLALGTSVPGGVYTVTLSLQR